MRKRGLLFGFAFGALCAGAVGLDYYVEYVEANGNQWVDTGVHRPRRASPGPVDFGGGAAIRLQ